MNLPTLTGRTLPMVPGAPARGEGWTMRCRECSHSGPTLAGGRCGECGARQHLPGLPIARDRLPPAIRRGMQALAPR